jgi:methylenetetrahydrofolate dehydrogenase (NADP+)/methenyltetrahydrofolate cyclohydrolase
MVGQNAACIAGRGANLSATKLDGAALAARIRAQVAEEVAALPPIGLATILVGDDPASHFYITRKHEAAEEVGIRTFDHRLPVPPVKDVDGFTPVNAGQLYLGRPTLVPATPLGIMALLDEYDVRLEGARAVVVGRSDIVGKPVAHLLLQANATVSICHSRTDDLGRYTRDADVLVAAAGIAGLIASDMVKPGAAVVDVGQNRTEAGLVGDVDSGAAEVAGFLTPVPGGVGPMTVAMLLQNTVRAARYGLGMLAFPGG